MTAAQLRAELQAERDELCTTFGFANRWTAMVYQWCRDAGFGDDGSERELGDVAYDLRAYVEGAKNVPAYRLDNVDFVQIALCLQID